MSAIIIENSLVHYEALGRGQPLLFLHGWLGSWRYWVPTMVDLAASHRAYALDFWGFGDSDKIAARYDIRGYVSQVALFVDQLGIDRTPIIGHGLGAIVGIYFALAYPDRAEQLLAVSTPLTSACLARSLSTFSGGENPARIVLGRRLKDYEEVDIEAAKTDGQAVVLSLRSAMDQDVLSDLQDLEVPVLLVNGQDDPLIQLPDAALLAGLGANISTLVFEGAQHYPMLDDASKFARLIRDFVVFRDAWDRIKLKNEWKRRIR